MGYRRTPFAPSEWYHCFNRGIDKRIVFEHPEDFKRFKQLFYLANDTQPIMRDNFYHRPHEEILTLPRTEPLVAIGAYCLMQNHYHLLLQELTEGGISKFMHKVGTGYTGYFNNKNNRVGNLLVKPFRSKHVDDDRYLQRVYQYIHLNPAELFEFGWKSGKTKNFPTLEKKLISYPHSSLPDYQGIHRPERAILDEKAIKLLHNKQLPLKSVLADMAAYYQEVENEF